MDALRLSLCVALVIGLVACASRPPLPNSQEAQKIRVGVIGALGSKAKSTYIAKTIFGNAETEHDIGWNPNEATESFVRQYYAQQGYDISQEKPDNAFLLGKELHRMGMSDRLLTDEAAKYICDFAATKDIRVFIVIAPMNMEDYVTRSAVRLEGYGLYHRRPVFGNDTVASYLYYTIIAYDCQLNRTIRSMHGAGSHKFPDLADREGPIPIDDAIGQRLRDSLTKLISEKFPWSLGFISLTSQ